MKELGKYLSELLKLIKLETMTMAGRGNLASILVLALFIVAYTTNDMLCYFISAARDSIQTLILKQNISNPYETINIFKVMIPLIVLIILCLFFLHINEKAKSKIDNLSNDESHS